MPNQRFLASGTSNGHNDLGRNSEYDQIIGVFDVESSLILQEKSHAHDGEILSIAASMFDGEIITVGRDGDVKFWSAKSGQYLGGYTAYPEEKAKSIMDMCFSERAIISENNQHQTQKTIITVSGGLPLNEGNKIKLFSIFHSQIDRSSTLSFGTELSDGVLQADGTFDFHSAITLANDNIAVRSLALSPDGKRIAIAQLNKPVTIFDIETHQLMCSYSEYAERLSFNATGALLGITRAGTLIKGAVETTPHSLSTLANITLTGALNSRGFLSVVDSYTGKPFFIPSEEMYDCGQGGKVLAFSPRDIYLLASISNQWDSLKKSEISLILLWDVLKKKQLAVIRNDDDYTNTIGFSPSGQYLVAGSCNKIALFDIDKKSFIYIVNLYSRNFNMKNLQNNSWGIHSLVFTNDTTFFTAQKTGAIQGWQIVSDRHNVQVHLKWHNALSLNTTDLSFNSTAHLNHNNQLLFIKNGATERTELSLEVTEKYKMGLENLTHRRFETALYYFKEVIASAPDFESSYLKKGEALLALKRSEEAEQAFTFLIALPNKNGSIKGEAYYQRGLIFVGKKDFDRAAQDYQFAMHWASKAAIDTEFTRVVQKKYDELVESLRLIKLFSACYLGYLYFAPLFQPEDVNKENPKDGAVLLDYALNVDNIQIIELLLNSGANPALLNGNFPRTPLSSMLMRKKRQRNMKIVQQLIYAKPEVVNTLDADGLYPLFFAVELQDIVLAECLLKAGSQIDTPVLGVTPLHQAVENIDTAMAILLLKHHANYEIESKGEVPLTIATNFLREPLLTDEQTMQVKMMIALLLTCYEYDGKEMPVNMSAQQKMMQLTLLSQEATRVRNTTDASQASGLPADEDNLCITTCCAVIFCCPCVVIVGALQCCGLFGFSRQPSSDRSAQESSSNGANPMSRAIPMQQL